MTSIRRDSFATALVAVIIGIYTVYLRHPTAWIVSSTRATTGVVFLLGVAVCLLGQAGDLYRRDRDMAMAVCALWTSLLGVSALTATVLGMVDGSPTALATLFGATVLLWATATLRHAYTSSPPRSPERDPGTHEVIDPDAHRHQHLTGR
jgi:hypothetical protein